LRKRRATALEVLSLALAAPRQEAPERAAAGLSEERRREIEQALAEASAEPWDPEGIARPWEDLRRAAG
jgi:hypothetical protein